MDDLNFGFHSISEETAENSSINSSGRDGRWVIVDLIGKGARVRSVPMPSWAKSAIDLWAGSAGFSTGHVFRPVNKGDRLAGGRMTGQTVFNQVTKYSAAIGIEKFAPHDLRRSYAKLAHKGHAPLEQIQISLAHASIQTTISRP